MGIDTGNYLYYISSMSILYRHTGIEMAKIFLPSQTIFDYTALINALKNYRQPRDKITKLLRDKTIIRVKKGLYLHNQEHIHDLPVKELLANLIYGPSYISLEYALSSYGMIPEAALQISSVTFKKTKRYRTPVGDFIYRSVPRPYYLTGTELRTGTEGYSYLIAGPEKALFDMLYFATGLHNKKDVRAYLFEDLRIDESSLRELDVSVIDEITTAAGMQKLAMCRNVLEELVK